MAMVYASPSLRGRGRPLRSTLALSLACLLSLLADVSAEPYRSYFHSPSAEFSLRDADSLAAASTHSGEGRGAFFELHHSFNAEALSKLGLTMSDGRFHKLLATRDAMRHGQTRRSRRHRRTSGAEVEAFPDFLAREVLATGQKSTSSLLPMQGNVYPTGLYRAMIALGTPEQTFNVALDTGSVLTWVNCQPCDACTSSRVQQLSSPYDSEKSSTWKEVSCTSPYCNVSQSEFYTNLNSPALPCKSGRCAYQAGYLSGGTATSGTLIEEEFWLTLKNSSQRVPTRVVFGCGNRQTGIFYNGEGWTVYDAIDGLMGLGRSNHSIPHFIMANSSLGIGNVFTLCLRAGFGGGLLAFGDSYVPEDTVYTAIMPNSKFFSVNLVGIHVNGHALSVPPAAYGDIAAGNAVFDSGTTFTLVKSELLRQAILNMIKEQVQLQAWTSSSGALCYRETDGMPVEAIALRFPRINLQFAGRGIYLNIPPEAYTYTLDDKTICTNLISEPNLPSPITILIGDVWMRNLVFVHDLEKQRIGWAPSLCTL